MKLASFRRRDEAPTAAHAALVDPGAGRLWPAAALTGADDMLSLLRRFDVVHAALQPVGPSLALGDVELLAPIPVPARNIFCVGKNYRDHVKERPETGFDAAGRPGGDALPEAPIIFTKAPSCVIADGQPIRLPTALSRQIDYEAELAVVIGRGGRAIPAARAYEHVWGYSILNDVTARDLQIRHKQWFLAKSIDGFCPMGPWLVSADEVAAANLTIRCWVNDELRQDGNTGDLIFDIPTLVATISAGITLQPGDIIATGTPAGVGAGFKPPRFLAAGDRVSIAIEGIGRLSNPVI